MIVTGSPGMSGVPVAKIDLTNDTAAIKELNIRGFFLFFFKQTIIYKGFPTVRFFANGSYSDYDGQWD